MKTFKNYLKTIPLTFILLTACSKDDSPTIKEPNIYITTTEYEEGKKGTIKLWKDGETTNITDGTYQSWGVNMSINGDDVYIIGQQDAVATIWKNGEATPLSNTSSSFANDIFIDSNNVYVVGNEREANEKNSAVLWKNGVKTKLTDGTQDASAKSIFVHNNNVYVVGFENNSDNKLVAKLWKNGEATNLTDGTFFARAISIHIHNNNVYIAFNEDNSLGKAVAKLWKNGQVTNLSDGSNSAYVRSLLVDKEENVYVTGYAVENGIHVAKLWKNGEATNLEGINAVPEKIAIHDNNIYVTGYSYTNSHEVAVFWKNGDANYISEENRDAYATGIFIK